MTYTNSKAQSGKGTVVSIGPIAGTASPTYTAIGEVKASNITGAEYKTADTSNFQSSATEFIGTIPDTGECTLVYNRVSNDAGQIALLAAGLTGVLYMFEIQLPINALAGQTSVGDLLKFNALVAPPATDIDTEKAIDSTVKLKISGSIAETEGS